MIIPATAQVPLMYDMAKKRVMQNNLELKTLQSRIDSKKEEINQARAISNPEVEVALENFGQNEIEAAVSQTFELGGKRKSRVSIARVEMEMMEIEYELKKLGLEAETIRRFLPLIAANNRVTLLDSAITIAQTTLNSINRRVKAGASMPIDAMRAEIELEELHIEKAMILREFDQLKKSLVILWSDSIVDFVSITGNITSDIVMPSIEESQSELPNHPEIKLINHESKLVQAQMRETKADVAPDLTVSGGYLRNNEAEENAALLAVSIDLPLFNRNQGALASKKHELKAQNLLAHNELIKRNAELLETYNQVLGINEQLAAIQSKILPKADTVFSTILRFYNLGRVSFLEVVESQSELLDIRTRLIELEVERALLIADLIELTGLKSTIISQ
jgi:cobalt-zinc-cadmium efflux system outer membrane protein